VRHRICGLPLLFYLFPVLDGARLLLLLYLVGWEKFCLLLNELRWGFGAFRLGHYWQQKLFGSFFPFQNLAPVVWRSVFWRCGNRVREGRKDRNDCILDL
jgi:hypothetical protein